MTEAVLFLPYPPPIHSLTHNYGRTRKPSHRYKEWQKEVEYALMQQKPLPRIPGEVRVLYEYGRPDRRKRDLENLCKATSDTLVKHGIIEDDSKIVELTMRWIEDGLTGCRVQIWSL